MYVSFLTPELNKWDQLDSSDLLPEALVLPIFADERPLRGAAGLCDWRLCGRLSRLLIAGRLRGEWGETLLYPPPEARLVFPRLLFVGLGAGDRFNEASASSAATHIVEVVDRLRLNRYAIALPGRSLGRLSARRALELYLEVADASQAPTELVVLESLAGQKEAADLARQLPSSQPTNS